MDGPLGWPWNECEGAPLARPKALKETSAAEIRHVHDVKSTGDCRCRFTFRMPSMPIPEKPKPDVQ